jgi:RNA polymerase sigma-70 factor (ECF subfamily)
MDMIWKDSRNQEQSENVLRRKMVMLLPRLRRFACSLAGEADKGDELVQAACERALGRLSQFREGTRLDSWMYRIIHTLWIDCQRRRKTRESHVRSRQHDPPQNREAPYLTRPVEAMVDIRKAMAVLPDEYRAAISLVVVEGYTYAEAAAILEIPAGTVASRVARARRELNQQLRAGHQSNRFTVHDGAGGKDMGR